MHWFGQMCTFKKERPGEIGARGANLPEPLHLSCAPGASAAPVLHSAWQNPATASPPHRSPTADCAAPALPVRTACPPHPVLPDHSPRRPTCKQRNAAPTEMVDAASTPKGEKAYSSAAEVSSTSAASSSVPSSCPPSSGTSATSGTTTWMISISGSSTRVQPPGI